MFIEDFLYAQQYIQTNCLERDKTKMDSASCKINSKTSHSGHFGILRDEPEDEWERETLD